MNSNKCWRCLKPRITCYCHRLRPFITRFQLVILQHPLERRKTVGTARMAHLCITDSKIIYGEQFNEDPQVDSILDEPDHHCVVLYPGANSINLSEASLAERWAHFPSQKKLVVFVIDGSWSFAKKMLKRSHRLSSLQRISFISNHESRYRIRHQPRPECLSTVEAVHRVVELLDPAVDPSNLIEVFQAMVEQQVKYAGRNQLRRGRSFILPQSQ